MATDPGMPHEPIEDDVAAMHHALRGGDRPGPLNPKVITDYTPETQEWLRVVGGLVEWGTLPAQRERLWVDIMVATLDGHPNPELAKQAAEQIEAALKGSS